MYFKTRVMTLQIFVMTSYSYQCQFQIHCTHRRHPTAGQSQFPLFLKPCLFVAIVLLVTCRCWEGRYRIVFSTSNVLDTRYTDFSRGDTADDTLSRVLTVRCAITPSDPSRPDSVTIIVGDRIDELLDDEAT